MTRLLPDSVRDSAAKIFGSIAARMVSSGCRWPLDEQKETADRCITAALSFEAAWKERKHVHDSNLEAAEEEHLRRLNEREDAILESYRKEPTDSDHETVERLMQEGRL